MHRRFNLASKGNLARLTMVRTHSHKYLSLYPGAPRRTANLLLACCIVVFAAVPVAGGTFRVEGSLHFGSDPGALKFFEESTLNPAGLGREVTATLLAPTATSTGYHLESAAFAGIAGLGSRAFGQISQDAPRGGFGIGTNTVRANSLAAATYDDVVVSGPAGSVTASVNMLLDGFVSLAAPVATSLEYLLARGRVEVSFYANGVYVGGGYQQRDLQYQSGVITPSLTADGTLSLWHGSGAFASPSFTVLANVPFSLEVRLLSRIYAAGFAGEVFNSSAMASFGDTLKFVNNGPVFNVPNGYTANSADAGIVGNAYSIPEPSTLALACWASLMFSFIWLRRQRCGV